MMDRALVATLGIVALAAVAFADPATSSFFPPCLWRAATGWLCPGCGSARALHALVHGRVIDALVFNPLTVAAIPVVGLAMADASGATREAMTYRIKAWHLRLLVVAMIGFGILRNVIP